MTIDPEPGKQGHGEIAQLFGFGDDNGLALESAKPMALAAMIAFNVMGHRFALHQWVLWDD